MAIAADILPVQPAPRPDAPARKPELETARAGDGKSFADVLGAEVEAAPTNEAVPARPVQPTPAGVAIVAPRKIAPAVPIDDAGAVEVEASEPGAAALPTAAAIVPIAQDKPKTSAMMPAESARITEIPPLGLVPPSLDLR